MTLDPHAAAAELLELWPALSWALERAQGAPSGERVTGGAGPDSSALPIDPDALATINRLTDDICATSANVGAYLGEGRTRRGVLVQLGHFPRQYDRLRARAAYEQSSYLAGCLSAWRGDVRRLVGLSVGDRHLGEWCPLHDAPLVELVAPGEQGQLTSRFLVAQDGLAVHTAAVDWIRTDAVTCRHCGAIWTPGPRYIALVRLLDAAEQRRSTPDEADADT